MSRLGLRQGLLLGLFAASGCLPATVTQPPRDPAATYLWGVYKGCQRDGYLGRAVEKRMLQMGGETGGEVRRVLPSKVIEHAAPPGASFELRRACASAKGGVLLGARVLERGAAPRYMLMRLWRVDLATQATQYRDHYCRGCDTARTLATQAAYFREHPDTAPSQQPALPTFCVPFDGSATPSAAPLAPDHDRLALQVRPPLPPRQGKLVRPGPRPSQKTLTALHDALRQHFTLTGRDIVAVAAPLPTAPAAQAAPPLPGGAMNTAIAPLTLVAEAPSDSEVRLFLWSRASSPKSPPKTASVQCPRCSADAMAARTARIAGQLVDNAVAEEVGRDAASSALWRLPLPPAASAALCAPLQKNECSSAGGASLDSDPSLSPFFEPQCGELVTGDAAGSR